MSTSASFRRTALRISAGVVVWALHFATVYGFTALACARGWERAVPVVVAGASAAAAAVLVAIIVAGWRQGARFEPWLSATLAAFALVAVAYETLPVLLLPACG